MSFETRQTMTLDPLGQTPPNLGSDVCFRRLHCSPFFSLLEQLGLLYLHDLDVVKVFGPAPHDSPKGIDLALLNDP